MDNNLFGLLFGGLLSLLILYFLIVAAVQKGNHSDYKDQQLAKQTNLLAAIARKNGVPEDDIRQIINN